MAPICFLIAFLSPIIILGYQIFIYMKSGEWMTLSVIDALQYCKFDWALSPNDRIGIWKILSFINISVPLFIGFFFLGLIIASSD